MEVFNRDVIEKFTERCPDEVVERVLNISSSLIDESISELKKKRPALAGKYNLKLVDEHYFDTSTVNSDLSLFVIFQCPQLELNTYNLVNNKFKHFLSKLKNAWLNSIKPKKIFKRRKKEKTKSAQLKQENIAENKYNILNLKQDLAVELANRIDSESYILFTKFGLKLVSKHELGIDVNIYPVIESNKEFKIYNISKNKFVAIDFKNREKNFNKKFEEIGENFIYMIRVFNNLHFTIYNCMPNQILIESLIYNVPKSLFEANNFYESFIKILNYFNNVELKNFKSIVNQEVNIFNEPLISENPVAIVSGLIKNIENNI